MDNMKPEPTAHNEAYKAITQSKKMMAIKEKESHRELQEEHNTDPLKRVQYIINTL